MRALYANPKHLLTPSDLETRLEHMTLAQCEATIRRIVGFNCDTPRSCAPPIYWQASQPGSSMAQNFMSVCGSSRLEDAVAVVAGAVGAAARP